MMHHKIFCDFFLYFFTPFSMHNLTMNTYILLDIT